MDGFEGKVRAYDRRIASVGAFRLCGLDHRHIENVDGNLGSGAIRALVHFNGCEGERGRRQGNGYLPFLRSERQAMEHDACCDLSLHGKVDET